MKLLVTLLALGVLTADAAPLLSPRHASQPKAKPMFKPASVGQPLAMKAYFRPVNSDFGDCEFTAQCLKPAGWGVVMEVSEDGTGWVFLSFFGPEATDQYVFTGLYSYSQSLSIRVLPVAPAPATAARAAAGPLGEIGLNQEFEGARAWKRPVKLAKPPAPPMPTR